MAALNGRRKIDEALSILKALDLPCAQQNERSALTLLALLGLKPEDPWSAAAAPLTGITPMMTFFAQEYGRTYAPNARETVRRHTVHQFMVAGLVSQNPDRPDRPVNSPGATYQINQSTLLSLQSFGQPDWQERLVKYRAAMVSLRERWAAERAMRRIPVILPDAVA